MDRVSLEATAAVHCRPEARADEPRVAAREVQLTTIEAESSSLKRGNFGPLG